MLDMDYLLYKSSVFASIYFNCCANR